ncbi:Hypothetical predicted protein [Pelobates cultripes]|uniref:Uncharacterized protein n=1 Tax=Pelobates cultripes TaxID=61616 RepID=A0AAD1W589_PELCU|nr:Hypothetical predicted protein [Pelobates cultripes]
MSKVWPADKLWPAFRFNMDPQVIWLIYLLWPPVNPRALLRIPGSLNAVVLSGAQGFNGGQEITRTQTDVQSLLVLSLCSRDLFNVAGFGSFSLEAQNEETENKEAENEETENKETENKETE